MVVGVVIAITTLSSTCASNLLANNTFGYIGQPANNSTNLLTLGGYRHYNPTQGTFLKQDSYSPFANNRTFNGFNYSAGNPVLFADQSGHMPIKMSQMIAIGPISLGIAMLGLYYYFPEEMNNMAALLLGNQHTTQLENIGIRSIPVVDANTMDFPSEIRAVLNHNSSAVTTATFESETTNSVLDPLRDIAESSSHTEEEKQVARQAIEELSQQLPTDSNTQISKARVLGATHAISNTEPLQAKAEFHALQNSANNMNALEQDEVTRSYATSLNRYKNMFSIS